MFLELCAILLVALWLWHRQKTARARKMIDKFPGPMALPIVGNVRKLGSSTVDFLKRATETNDLYSKEGAPFRLLLGSKAIVVLTHPKDFEIILSSQKHIEKGFFYKFIMPWLGTGLLTSSGSKWRNRRKILTPAFHFSILEDFLEVFRANVDILVDRLRPRVNGPGFDVYNYLTLYTLDNICETAMGVKVNAQHDNESEYVKAIRDQTSIVMQRAIVRPWLSLDLLFNMTNLKSVHEKSLKILHDTTNRVIRSRRAVLEKERSQGVQNRRCSIGKRKRLAFLDILVEAAFENSGMTDEDIREEVDTFMFEGHDTTSSAVSFALWLLSWNQDIQDGVCRELKTVFPEESDPVTMRGLQELKYLERVIKETLRIYPSVPTIARLVHEDVTLSGGLVIPGGTTVNVSIIASHTNPTFWPDPFKFDPERFTPENSQGRHPYAYVPFSAGPRNCIGQKFAMLEIKVTLCAVLRAFKVLPGSAEPNLQLANELIIISANGIPVRLEERDFEHLGAENLA